MSSRNSRQVVVATQGGLGNQLFQLAAGHHLAQHLNAQLVVDDTGAQGRSSLTLHAGAPLTTLSQQDRFALRAMHKRNQTVLKLLGTTYIYEPECGPPIELPKAKRVVLKGYFQLPHYYGDLSGLVDVVRKELRQRIASPRVSAFAAEVPTIGIHVRRGDYLHGAAANELGFVGTGYYREALHQLSKRFPNARFIGFSDDPTYFASTDLGAAVHDASDYSDVETLITLSSCSALVLSNSSLSWWAAQLSRCNADLVFVPTPWSRTNKWINPADPSWTSLQRTDDPVYT